MIAQQIHVGFPKARDGSDVFPIALKGIGIHLFTCGQHGGDDVFTEIVGGIGIGIVGLQILHQFLAVEDIDTHGSLGAVGLLGLFTELVNGIILIGAHDTEAACLLDRHVDNGDGAIGAHLLMIAEHLGIVHLIDVVTRKNENILCIIAVDKLQILINGIGSAAVPVSAVLTLIGGEDLHAAVSAVEIPRQTVADVLIEYQGLILRQNADGIDAGIDTVGKGEIDDAVFAAEGYGGLCGFGGQHVKSASLAACKQHGDAFFLSEHDNASYV